MPPSGHMALGLSRCPKIPCGRAVPPPLHQAHWVASAMLCAPFLEKELGGGGPLQLEPSSECGEGLGMTILAVLKSCSAEIHLLSNAVSIHFDDHLPVGFAISYSKTQRQSGREGHYVVRV